MGESSINCAGLYVVTVILKRNLDLCRCKSRVDGLLEAVAMWRSFCLANNYNCSCTVETSGVGLFNLLPFEEYTNDTFNNQHLVAQSCFSRGQFELGINNARRCSEKAAIVSAVVLIEYKDTRSIQHPPYYARATSSYWPCLHQQCFQRWGSTSLRLYDFGLELWHWWDWDSSPFDTTACTLFSCDYYQWGNTI